MRRAASSLPILPSAISKTLVARLTIVRPGSSIIPSLDENNGTCEEREETDDRALREDRACRIADVDVALTEVGGHDRVEHLGHVRAYCYQRDGNQKRRGMEGFRDGDRVVNGDTAGRHHDGDADNSRQKPK
jgi:hypothetical protein